MPGTSVLVTKFIVNQKEIITQLLNPPLDLVNVSSLYALWSRTTKNPGVSTGPLACPFARLLICWLILSLARSPTLSLVLVGKMSDLVLGPLRPYVHALQFVHTFVRQCMSRFFRQKVGATMCLSALSSMCPFACPSIRFFHPSISIKRHEISAKRCLAPLRLAQRDFCGNLLGFWCRRR